MRIPEINPQRDASENGRDIGRGTRRAIGITAVLAALTLAGGSAYYAIDQAPQPSPKASPAKPELTPEAQLDRQYGGLRLLGQSPHGDAELAFGQTKQGNDDLYVSGDRGKEWSLVARQAHSAVWAPKGATGPDIFAATYSTRSPQGARNNLGLFALSSDGTVQQLESAPASVTDLGPMSPNQNALDYEWTVQPQGGGTLYTFNTFQAIGWQDQHSQIEFGAMPDVTVRATVP